MASLVGTAVEWYVFQIYGLAAAVVFSRLFFPNVDPLIGTLAAFAAFGVGFFGRPLGGAVFGHFGDRIGRKSMLVVSLLMMGSATVLIGCLPTYGSIGILAPVLLVALRFVQGIGLGGEWGGAVLMAVEYAPPGKRGLYGSLAQMGSPAGLLLATGVFGAVSLLPEEQFLAWGWRIPFLLSALLIAVGLFVRLTVAETPAFTRAKEAEAQEKMPILEVIRSYPKSLLLAFGAFAVSNGAFYVFVTYMASYGTVQLGVSSDTMLVGAVLFAVGEFVAIPLFAALSDRVGRRPVFIASAAFTMLYAFPAFWLVGTTVPALIWLAVGLGGVCVGALYGIMGAFASELFGTEVRYSGASLGYQLSAAIAGGLTPFVATAMVAAAGGGYWPVPAYLAALGLISLLSMYLASETYRSDLSGQAAVAERRVATIKSR